MTSPTRVHARWFAAAAVVAVTVLIALTSTASTQAGTGTRKVMWIVMENHTYSSVIGNASAAPYINHTLLQVGGSATDMHNETHPSMPNYIAMSTGSTQGLADDGGPRQHPLHVASIFSQVDPSWRAYAEVMPKNCAQSDTDFRNSTAYMARHNPPTYLVASPINAPYADCSTYDRPMGSLSSGRLADDLADGDLPRFSLVVPGICHDMHAAVDGGTCSPRSPIAAGDEWLSHWMPVILKSPDYTSGRLVVFLTWDEGSGSGETKGMDCLSSSNRDKPGCHIPTLVFSTSTRGGSRSGAFFSHYSMLKTTEQLLGESTENLGSRVANSTSMRNAFNL